MTYGVGIIHRRKQGSETMHVRDQYNFHILLAENRTTRLETIKKGTAKGDSIPMVVK